MKVWINGSFVDENEAKVGVFDAGFQHGVGLFETMIAKNGRVFQAEAHMNRLKASAAGLRLTEKLHVEPLIEALHLTLKENGQSDARMRLTITGGDLNMLQRTGEQGNADPTVVIQSQPPTQYPDAFFEKGVYVTLASGRVNPYEFGAGHKTLNYWSKLLNLQLAAMQQCGEALWLTPSATLAGGCVSNLFAVKNGTLFTPTARGEEDEQAEPSAVLPGVTREVVIALADELDADELFLTNSSWGVLPVIGMRVSVKEGDQSQSQEQAVADGTVGKMTSQLIASYTAKLIAETA